MASSTAIKCCPALGGVAKVGGNFSCAPNYGSLVALPREKHDGIHLAEIVIFPGAANHKLRDQGFVSTARAFGLQLFSWLTFDGQRRPGVLVDLINFDGLSSTVSGTFAVVLEPPFKIRSKFKSLEDCKVYLVEHIAEMHQTLPHDVELAAADDDSLDTWVAHQPQFKQMGITPASINAYIRQVHLDKKIELATKMAAEHVTQYMAKHHSGKKATTATATKARADLEGMNRNVQAWLQKRAGYLKLPMQHRVFCVQPADPLWINVSKDGYSGQAAWPPMWTAPGGTVPSPPWAIELTPTHMPPPTAQPKATEQQVATMVADAELGPQAVRAPGTRASKAAAKALAASAVASERADEGADEEPQVGNGEEEDVIEEQVQKEKEVPHALSCIYMHWPPFACDQI